MISDYTLEVRRGVKKNGYFTVRLTERGGKGCPYRDGPSWFWSTTWSSFADVWILSMGKYQDVRDMELLCFHVWKSLVLATGHFQHPPNFFRKYPNRILSIFSFLSQTGRYKRPTIRQDSFEKQLDDIGKCRVERDFFILFYWQNMTNILDFSLYI